MKGLMSAVVLLVATAGSFVTTVSALTPEEIAVLREAGVEESVIEIMKEQSQPGVGYMEDEKGNRYKVYSTGTSQRDEELRREEEEKVERAWEMLRDLRIDTRPDKRHGW